LSKHTFIIFFFHEDTSFFLPLKHAKGTGLLINMRNYACDVHSRADFYAWLKKEQKNITK